MGCLNLTLTQFIKMFHSTERRGLCLMKCTCETIQVFVIFFFVFSHNFCPNNALIYFDIYLKRRK